MPTHQHSHTRLISDQYERCLYSHGLRITREGKHYKKLETVQLWRCMTATASSPCRSPKAKPSSGASLVRGGPERPGAGAGAVRRP